MATVLLREDRLMKTIHYIVEGNKLNNSSLDLFY